MTRRKDPTETRVPVAPDNLPAFEPVPRKYRHDGWTPERQRAFIGALADTGSVSRAARYVNMSPEGAYYLRRRPGAESFPRAWEAALDLGAFTAFLYAFYQREVLYDIFETISGQRFHPSYTRVGGLLFDLNDDAVGRIRKFVQDFPKTHGDMCRLLNRNRIFMERMQGIGVLSKEMAIDLGCTGPIARASGVDVDLRRDEPYLAYGELFGPGGPGRVVTRAAGDCLARFECLLEQTHNSLDLADACLDRIAELPPGPINQRLPKVLKAPEGHTYAWTENPLGLNGYYLVSRGERTPYRLKLRSASFNNIQALSRLLPGTLVADMVAILGSFFFVVGDIDK